MNKILLLLLFTGILIVSKAQVVYTDIPDATGNISGNYYSLDLNNDGTADFNIIVDFPSGLDHNQVTIDCLGNGQVLVTGTFFQVGDLGGALSLNTNIASTSSTWKTLGWTQTINECFLAFDDGSTTYGGNFLGMNNLYLPLRISINNNYHYGWVRVDVNSNSTSFTIKDYAYNNTPGQAIKAGQTTGGGTTGIVDNTFEQVSIFFHNKTIFLSSPPINSFQLHLYNVLGKEVFNTTTETSADVSQLPDGIYIATFTSGTLTISKKIIVQ